MENPTLSLSIESGPKKGKTLECKSSEQIQIGRIARGNTFSIKDSSISEKHLSIQFLQEINNWAITDLSSSNGTILNNTRIPPNTPCPIATGDIIKIGQKSSFLVHVSEIKALEVEDDMDKMTMGEWFDRMEVYLTKEVNMAAEEFIATLREKACLFDEYIDQNSNARGDE